MESNIGKICHFYESKEDMFKHIFHDAEVIAKKMEPHMQVLNLTNPYDSEVAIAAVTSMLACLTTILERNYGAGTETHVMAVYDFFKKESIEMLNEKEKKD